MKTTYKVIFGDDHIYFDDRETAFDAGVDHLRGRLDELAKSGAEIELVITREDVDEDEFSPGFSHS